VFRAVNACEAGLAVAVVVCFVIEPPTTGTVVAAAVAIVTLLAQVVAVRPRLSRRSDVVLAGGEGPRSHAHFAYVGLEIVKVLALLIAGVLLLAA
jgi:hypothetical protein